MKTFLIKQRMVRKGGGHDIIEVRIQAEDQDAASLIYSRMVRCSAWLAYHTIEETNSG
jgi:hypothetical protein